MALGSIGGIVVKVSADTTQFNSAMGRVGSKIATNAKQLRESSLQYQKWAAAGAAAAVVVGAAMVKSQLQTLDALAKTSDALKIQQERLQALQHVATLTGTSAAQLGVNLERMQRRIGEVARKGGLAGKALEEIGISAKDMINLSADEQLVQISQAMGGMENASLRASIAMDLFGRDGVRMLKMLEQLKADGLQGTVEELESLGVALSRVDTAKVEQANDAMFKSQQVVEGIVNKVAVKVSPILEAMSKGFIDSAKEAGGFGESVDSAFKTSIKVIGVFADGLHGVSVIFSGLKVAAFAIAKVVNEAFRIMAKGVEGFVNLGVAGINKLIDAVNVIPGVAIPAIKEFSSAAAVMMQQFSDQASENLTGSIEDLHNKMMEPLPSSVLDQFVKDAEAASTAIAEAATEGTPGGGGGAGLTQEERAAMDEKINAIKESLKTEREIKDAAFAADIQAIREFGLLSEEAKAEADALELARVQQHAADMIAIENDKQDKITNLEQSAQNAIASMKMRALNSAVALLDQFAGKSKKAAVAAILFSKGIALAQNIQSTLVAQMRAMSDLGPIAGPPVAAGIGTWGAVNSGLIAATGLTQAAGALKGNSSPLTSSGGLPAVNTTSGGQQQQNQNINISGINADSLISGGQLVSKLNAALGDGYTINFAGG